MPPLPPLSVSRLETGLTHAETATRVDPAVVRLVPRLILLPLSVPSAYGELVVPLPAQLPVPLQELPISVGDQAELEEE